MLQLKAPLESPLGPGFPADHGVEGPYTLSTRAGVGGGIPREGGVGQVALEPVPFV